MSTDIKRMAKEGEFSTNPHGPASHKPHVEGTHPSQASQDFALTKPFSSLSTLLTCPSGQQPLSSPCT